MKNKFYSLVNEEKKATLSIYGDITSFPWLESDVSAYNLTKEIDALDVDEIDVFINSYGGEVAEGLAIYNALKRHKAKVVTYVDGFACSIASVIAMAGDERKMYRSSLLMIHNAWTCASGNAAELRKQADDLETIMTASIATYMSVVNISEGELKELLDGETWITPDEALEKGFITEIVEDAANGKHSQSARQAIFQKVITPEAKTDFDVKFNEFSSKVDKFSEMLDKFNEKLNKIAEKEEKPQDDTCKKSVETLEKFLKNL